MNKSPFWNTPAGILIAVGLIILGGEFLIMLLIESIHATLLKDAFLERMAFEFLDPLLLITLVSPALFLLIFKPMCAQQVELEQQLDELRRFQRLSIGRELRAKELVEENTALLNKLSAEPAGDIPVMNTSRETPRHAAAQHDTTQPTEQNQRSALLFMLEDLEAARKQIEDAHQEWVAALDVVEDPIFLHDKQFRILRCNKAYQQLAGIPFHELIGQPYYDVFPKTHVPMSSCLQAMEKSDGGEEVALGGAIYRSRAFSIHDAQGAYLYSVHTLEDVTEHKRMTAAIIESEEKFRKISESAQDAIIMMGTDQRISFWNAASERIFGYTAAEALGRELHGLIVPEPARALFKQAFPHFRESGKGPIIGKLIEVTALRKGGEEFPVELSVSATQFGEQWYAIAIVRDISKRKQIEEMLRKSHERFELAIKGTNDGIWEWDIGTNANYFSPRFMELIGYGPGELSHELATFEFLLHPEDRAWVFDRVRQHLEDKVPYSVEYRLRTKNGGYKWFQARGEAARDPSGKPYRMAGSVTDISERKHAEEMLRASETRNRLLFESSRDALMLLAPPSWKFTGPNQATLELFGAASVAEFTALGPGDVSPERQPDGRLSSEKAPEMIAIAMREGSHFFEWEHRRLDGSPFAADVLLTRMQLGEDVFLQATVRDITERKQAEVAITHANRALAALSEVNRSVVYASDENELLQNICRAIVEHRSYQLAWVGYVQHDEHRSIKTMAHAGHDAGYLEAMQLTWLETERGMGPSGRAVRSGTTQLCQDIANDPLFLPWCDAARQHGYAASIALPLLDKDNTVFGVLSVYAGETNAFTPNEIALLEQMAGDLAFGVNTLHTRHERDLAMEQSQRHLEQLRDSLEDTVRAMASLVEMRDPYTAGHQIRVADLAAAIARHMGLPDEQCHAIHLGGTVHDLGKIKIPSEILSKPGKIGDMEFSLIKIHPQAGYDILKDIHFLWPIAQMVLQHHERLDGSGYPQGLKGDDIILEARILSVADVVEAITSHRPYRPGLGVEAALAEISQKRGIHYDAAVVDACLALFREQHYNFQPSTFS